MDKFIRRILRSKKSEKENIPVEDTKDSRGSLSRHVKFGLKKNENARISYYSDYDDDCEDSSVETLKISNILKPYSVITKPKNTKACRSLPGVLDDNDCYNSSRLRSSRVNRYSKPSTSNDNSYNRSFQLEYVPEKSTRQDLKNLDYRMRKAKKDYLRASDRHLQYNLRQRKQPFQEYYVNNLDEDSRTNSIQLSRQEYNNPLETSRNYFRNQMKNSQTDSQMSWMTRRIVELEEQLALCETKLQRALEKAEYQKDKRKRLENALKTENLRELEWYRKHFANELQKNQLQNQKNNYHTKFLKLSPNFSNNNYSTAPTTLMNSDTATVSSMGISRTLPKKSVKNNQQKIYFDRINKLKNSNNIQKNDLKKKNYYQLQSQNQNNFINQNNLIDTSAVGIPGSGESLANFSTSPIGFSDSSAGITSISTIDKSATINSNYEKSKKLRDEYSQIFNPFQNSSENLNIIQNCNQQCPNKTNIKNNQLAGIHEMEQHYALEDISNASPNNLILMRSNGKKTSQLSTKNYNSLSTLITNTNKAYSKSYKISPNNFNNSVTQQNVSNIINNCYSSNKQQNETNNLKPLNLLNYSLRNTINDENEDDDEIKVFRDENVDSSRHNTDFEEMEISKKAIEEELLNSSSKNSPQFVSTTSSPEIARKINTTQFSPEKINNLENTLTEDSFNNAENFESAVSSNVSLHQDHKKKFSKKLIKQLSASLPELINFTPKQSFSSSNVIQKTCNNCANNSNSNVLIESAIESIHDENKENICPNNQRIENKKNSILNSLHNKIQGRDDGYGTCDTA